jgi:hypothetical protein
MTPLEAVQHYPTQQMIRAIAQGKQPLPDDLLLRASVERLITGALQNKISRLRRRERPSARPRNAELEPVRPLDEVLTPANSKSCNGNGEKNASCSNPCRRTSWKTC